MGPARLKDPNEFPPEEREKIRAEREKFEEFSAAPEGDPGNQNALFMVRHLEKTSAEDGANPAKRFLRDMKMNVFGRLKFNDDPRVGKIPAGEIKIYSTVGLPLDSWGGADFIVTAPKGDGTRVFEVGDVTTDSRFHKIGRGEEREENKDPWERKKRKGITKTMVYEFPDPSEDLKGYHNIIADTAAEIAEKLYKRMDKNKIAEMYGRREDEVDEEDE